MLGLLKKFVRLIIVVYVFAFAYLWAQPINEDLTHEPRVFRLSDANVHFFADETFLNAEGKREVRQEIWDEIFGLIASAERFVVLDMFLFNDFQGANPEMTRALSSELVSALEHKRADTPHIAVAFVTDPINTVYGGAVSPLEERLVHSGVVVVTTNLRALRDSNLTWSSFWRPFISFWGNTPNSGSFPHPFQFDGQKVPLRSWLALLNFKANHRKLVVADHPVVEKGKVVGEQTVTIVTSSNPHDGSSAHGNVALRVDGGVWRDVLENESVIATLSNAGLPLFGSDTVESSATGTLRVTFLREEQIRDKALELIASVKKGDQLDLEMFYLSDRPVVRALADASVRGANVRIILDPNKDAFGHEKNGIPNRPVAKELISRSRGGIVVRWCDTHGEQCHGKMLMGKTASSTFLMLGSANFTRRNIGGFNLEADISAESDREFTAWKDARAHFERLWMNAGGGYTVAYEAYRDDTFWKATVYRIMERTGFSSF